MKADHTRWCSSKEYPLSIKLESILNEYDSKVISKANLHMSRFLESIKKLDVLDTKTRLFYGDYLVKHTKSTINTYEYPVNVKTHLLNLVTAIYRGRFKV